MERRGSVLFLAAAAIGAPTFGLLAALPAVPGLVMFWVMQRRLDRFRRPELALLACLVVLEVGLGISLGIAHGPRVFLLPMLIMPVLLASVVFPVRVAVLAVIFGTQVLIGVALIFDLSAIREMPFALLYPLAVMIAGSGIAMVVAGLDVSTRGTAIVDPLTELPNRMALRARVAELEHQSRVSPPADRADRRRPRSFQADQRRARSRDRRCRAAGARGAHAREPSRGWRARIASAARSSWCS